MNKVVLRGRLTKDVAMTSKEERTIAKWSVAIEDRTWKQEDGTYHTDFVPCVAYGKTAEIAKENLYKGKEILLFGKMQSGKYTNKENKTIYTLEMRVDEIEFIGKKEEISIPREMIDEMPFR